MPLPIFAGLALVFGGVATGAVVSQALDNKEPSIGTINQPITALPFSTIMGYTIGALALLYAANSLGILKK